MLYLLPHIVNSAAERASDHEAFRFNGEALTYARLVRESNGLASILAEMNVRRGDRVGILMRKGLSSAIALYGVMKAGAAYVPLDPFAPRGRLESVIRHCGIRHVVTDDDVITGHKNLDGVLRPVDFAIGLSTSTRPGLSTCTWEDVSARSSDSAPEIRMTEDDLAYVMYTSGSTGEPKGIMHTHRSGMSYARTSHDLYELASADRLSNHSPLHFDMSTFDYFAGPLAAATTVIISEAHSRLPASLSQLVQDERLTVWYSVPFALTQMLLRGALDQRDLSSLRWVLFGGEPFPTKYLRDLVRLMPNATFSNVYGPAEVNQCTFYNFTIDDLDEEAESVPLGTMWPNSEGLIVDDDDSVVPPGSTGELLVRTPTMMQGYWKDEPRNEQAFFVRPTVGGAIERFYRTGDLVRKDDYGLLTFLGRRDRQVKIRGYRVELDEVEATLVSHSAVEEAAVFTVPRPEGIVGIEASVILFDAPSTTDRELVRYLGDCLPAYAVPDRITILSAFPRTGTGKINRELLGELALKNES